jgi:peptide/nickel transport system substrate-binding protein
MKYRIALALAFLALLLISTSLAGAQQTYSESPMLAERVQAGTLPPVAERLPENPRVVSAEGADIGTYGGDLRDPFVGDAFWSSQMIFWTVWKGLVAWTPDYSDWQPNIAESVDVSDDATSYTFHLRKGLKWSDGVDFTADDLMFFFEDILGNSELNSGSFPNGVFKPGTEAPTVSKTDDDTFNITFDVPYGMFLLNLCTYDGWTMVAAPKHYLSQFHDKYNHDGIPALIEQTEGASDWVSLFQAHSAVGPATDAGVIARDVNYPTMFPWIYTQPMGTGTQFIAERNPYYYAVDAAGNQLPYIDRIVGTSYQDTQTMLVDVLAGKFDTMANSTDEQRPLFYDNEATSGLAIYPTKSEGGGTVSINFNETNSDLGDIFANKDFRIGMSYAIDRQEVIDIVYFGQGVPRQVSPIEDSPLYNEQLTTQYIDYDVDKANEYLDKVLPDKDAEGFRIDPKTGEKLSIVFTIQTGDYGLRFGDVAELLKQYYAAVGVDIIIDTVDNQVLTDRINDNSVEAAIFTSEGGYGITAITDPRYFVPMHGQSIWGNGWQLWYLQPNNEHKVEPPQYIQDQVALYKQVLQAPTSEERIELEKQVLQNAADNFWVIGISSASDSYRPLSARLGNVPETWVNGWNPGGVAIAAPEQWYFKS